MKLRPKQAEMFAEVDAWRACPSCNSKEIRYRTTSNEYVCRRCGRVWDAKKKHTPRKVKATR